MEKSAAISLVLLAAALALQANSAPVSGCKHDKDSLKPPTSGKCEYQSLNKEGLIDDIVNACDIIIDNSSDIHENLLGAKSVSKMYCYIASIFIHHRCLTRSGRR